MLVVVVGGLVEQEAGGGAADLVAAGALLSRRLRPGQARIVLLALLAAGVGPRWIGAYLGR